MIILDLIPTLIGASSDFFGDGRPHRAVGGELHMAHVELDHLLLGLVDLLNLPDGMFWPASRAGAPSASPRYVIWPSSVPRFILNIVTANVDHLQSSRRSSPDDSNVQLFSRCWAPTRGATATGYPGDAARRHLLSSPVPTPPIVMTLPSAARSSRSRWIVIFWGSVIRSPCSC
ncbi:hypothetical protein HBB16_02040 [Pseudonocardia sp. MCCB 268]|nr:hypothetical protein [Pseudonocardia cytotoxica]